MWRRWFAWRPVMSGRGRVLWLVWCECRRYVDDASAMPFKCEYRRLTAR